MSVRSCDQCVRPPKGERCPDYDAGRVRWDEDGNVICANFTDKPLHDERGKKRRG